MKAAWPLLLTIILLSGCLGEYRVKPHESGVRVEVHEATTTSTTTTSTTTSTFYMVWSSTSTTQRRQVPIEAPHGITTTSVSTSTTTSATSTTTTSTTTTTLEVTLNRRVYTRGGENVFYLREADYTTGEWVYTVDYNTSDGRWDTIVFDDEACVDGLKAEVVGMGPGVAVTLRVSDIPYVRANTPSGASAIMVGGGLVNRSFGDYVFSLDSLHTDRVKLRVYGPEESKVMEIRDGDVVYNDDLELGVIDSRVSGGYAIVYALDDKALFREHEGVRFCGRDLLRYADATPLLVNAGYNTTYKGMNLTVRTYKGPTVTLGVYRGDFHHDFQITCGSSLLLFGERFNMLWYGKDEGGTAKLVAHT